MIYHPIPPVYDGNSRILILGSFPSVKSRETGFFYGHAQNRLWRVLAALCHVPVPESIPERKELLLSHGIAMWDTLAACDIRGSADSTIRHATPNDLTPILTATPDVHIFANGRTAHTLFCRYTLPRIHRTAVCLPSTSPANAAWTLDRLIEAWGKEISPFLL